MLLTGSRLLAQGWDAPRQASSWAKQDRDDTFTFYDSASKTLYAWLREAGVLAAVPTGRLEEAPERWVMDPRNNAWVTHGANLSQVDRSGRILASLSLPAPVGDIGWDAKGFVLSYRSAEPYLEKRDYRGALLWSFGAKPERADAKRPANRRPIVLDDAGNVLIADGTALNLAILDGLTGRKRSETRFLLPDGRPAPLLEGPGVDRGPLAIWSAKGVVFAALKAGEIPAPLRGSLEGLALARLDYAQARVEFLPTGLDDRHLLVGVLDAQAVFVSPKGGLMLVSVH